jgi:uncharacterized protein YbjT (DUF2867 family)
MKTAVVIGSTGLIGQLLVEKLAQEGSWTHVLAISRKSVTWSSPKIRTLIFDFVNWSELEMQIQSFGGSRGIDFFCCLGTTIAKAKSKSAFQKIDLEAVVQFAKLATRCRAEQLLVVSSMGADEKSNVFYNLTKGQMESYVRKEFAGTLHLMRPSLLLGDRKDFRFVERLAILAAPLYSPLLLGRMAEYRPIQAGCVAKAMVLIASKNVPDANFILENSEIKRICR